MSNIAMWSSIIYSFEPDSTTPSFDIESFEPHSIDQITSWRIKPLDLIISNQYEPKLGAQDLVMIAEDLCSGSLSLVQSAHLLEDHAKKYFPHLWKASTSQQRKEHTSFSNKQLWCANYAAIQHLYKIHWKDAAASILTSKWWKAYMGCNNQLDGMDDY